jgi:hypothetical protein
MQGDSHSRHLAILLAAMALTACAAPPPSAPPMTVTSAVLPPPSPLRPFPPTREFVDCVPYARAVSGLALYGDAWTWWDRAASRYARGQQPRIGAVLAWQRTASLASGHVAVVVEVQGPRQILVSHANWGRDGDTRGKIHVRQPVIDVSPNNDWTELRLMNTQGTFGRVYPARGFIYQPTDERHAESVPSG